MVARLNFRNFGLLKKLIALSCAVVIATVLVFSFNPPKKANASVVAGVAIAGCLAVLMASYFAVSGVQVTNNGGSESYVEGWYNDIINQYRQASIEHENRINTFFDQNGDYVGPPEGLQFVLSDEQQIGFWQMGKGVTALMEDIKSWFVSTFSVTSTPSVLESSSDINGYTYITNNSFSTYNAFVSVCPCAVGDYSFQLTDDYVLNFSITSFGGNNYNKDVYYMYEFGINDVFQGSGSFTESLSRVPDRDISNVIFAFYPVFTNNTYRVSLGQQHFDGTNYYLRPVVITNLGIEDGVISEISLEGALTDGYQDYQDALNNDLEKESDNDDAVVQVGVGELPDALTGEQIYADLLEKATSNTLEGTYEGVYENQEEATEDKEGETEFVPEVPEGWVVVNGLQFFFPFCVPWDMYSVIALLNASPEAPYLEWEMSFGEVFEPYTVVFDFSKYEVVAMVLRTMLVIVFLFGLIRKTRSLIRG